MHSVRKSREAVWAVGLLVAIVLLTRALTRVAPPCPYTICGIRPGMTRAEVARLPGIRLSDQGATPECICSANNETVRVVFRDGRVEHVVGRCIEQGTMHLTGLTGLCGDGYKRAISDYHEFFQSDASLHMHEGDTYHGRFYDVFLAAEWPGRFSLTAKAPELAGEY